MYRLLLRSPSYYWTLVENRIVRPMAWYLWPRRSATKLSDEMFVSLSGSDRPPHEFIQSVHEDVRFRFFFHPRNQKDFFLNLLTKTQSEESLLAESQDVLRNRFDTLGSGKVFLGDTINWHRDFKSGKVWDRRPSFLLDLMDRKNPTDVKVPWELSRFHQVWWLGKAYWLTRNERYARKFVELVEDWIDNNPGGFGVNWAVAMELAFRATNWIAGYYFFCESRSISDEFWMKFFKSLFVHGQFIRNHLEYTWRNENHIVSDIVGLIVLGIFFRSMTFGKKWLSWGVKNLEIEMNAQVHEDGVDYEKSTSYQRLVAELFYTSAILCQRNRISLSKTFMDRLEKMIEFIQSYTRPDGSIPLVGDADDGRLFRFTMSEDINDHRHALSVGAILFNRGDFKKSAGRFSQDALWLFGGEGFERYQMLKADTSAGESHAFADGGFYVMRGENIHVMIDAGDIGTDGMGGHGHNDTLSFEYWANGKPLIVDSGTYAYTFDVAARQQMRGTRSHNTVVVDGKEIAHFAGLWLIMSDKTKPRVFEWSTSPSRDILEAAHYAYGSAFAPLIHRRRMVLDKKNLELTVEDHVEGRGVHAIESYLHFAPFAGLQVVNSQKVLATVGDASFAITTDAGVFEVVETWFSKSYGIREKNSTVVLKLNARLPQKIAMVVASL